ncbi:MAG: type II toxin-antitoxin system prevent-host-death family antitoxin [Gemmatimonadetes bacterium]|nr:type II toxin-antitoxin system prevent-host-death family antitoxin [Gemmatimonadota bacterium]
MKRVSVSEAKSGLIALLDAVRRGETVLITDDGEPVARLEPYEVSGLADDEAAAALVRRGVVRPPRTRLDVERFLARPRPRVGEGLSASEIAVEERDDRF